MEPYPRVLLRLTQVAPLVWLTPIASHAVRAPAASVEVLTATAGQGAGVHAVSQ